MTDCSDPSGSENQVKHSFSVAIFGDRRLERFLQFPDILVPRPKFQIRGRLYLYGHPIVLRHTIFENLSKITGESNLREFLKYDHSKSRANLLELL